MLPLPGVIKIGEPDESKINNEEFLEVALDELLLTPDTAKIRS